MELNKQHLNTVNDFTVSELAKIVVVGLLFCLFTYLLWQMFHSVSQGIITLIRGLIPRVA